MSFAHPTYLWLLLGLIIPLVIHFWSNRSGKVIKVGSVKFMEASESSKSSSVKLNEIALLLLRMALLAMLIGILAEPFMTKSAKNKAIVYLVAPSLSEDPQMRQVIEAIEDDEAVRMFASGFPAYDNAYEVSDPASTNSWQLATAFHTLKADSIVVFSKGLLKDLKGKKPRITVPFSWVVINNDKSKTIPLQIIESNQNTELLSLNTGQNHNSYQRSTLDNSGYLVNTNEAGSFSVSKNGETFNVVRTITDTLKIHIVDDGSITPTTQFISKSFEAIKTYLNIPIAVVQRSTFETDQSSPDLVIWNSQQAIPEITTKHLIFEKNEFADAIITPGTKYNQWILNDVLTPERMIEEQFAQQLVEILGIYEDTAKRVEHVDQRVLESTLAQPTVSNAEAMVAPEAKKSLGHWLWFLFIPVLIAERILAKIRKQ